MPCRNEPRACRSGTGPNDRRRAPRARSQSGSHHLFKRWPEVAERLHSAKQLVLFLDFDGTLVALSNRPFEVRLGRPLAALLRRLASHQQITVYIISGRDLADLGKRATARGVRLLGMHGWEGRKVPSLRAERRLLGRARKLLEERLANLPHVWVQDKGLGLAVHYRGAVPSAVQKARPMVLETVRIFAPQLRLLHGKKIWELLPRMIEGKGPAVRAVLEGFPRSALPVFVGDDTTDESAFAALGCGITIRVGNPRRTRARFYLRDPDEVMTFLHRLEGEIA